MERRGATVYFDSSEQQLGLPARLPCEQALAVADDLMRGADFVQTRVEQMAGSPHALSRDAFRRYVAGYDLAELASEFMADEVAAYLRAD